MAQGYGIGGALQAAGGAMMGVASQIAEMRKLEQEQQWRKVQADNIAKQIEQQEIEDNNNYIKEAEKEYQRIYAVDPKAADDFAKNIFDPLSAAYSKTRRLQQPAAEAIAKNFASIARRNLGINLAPRVKSGQAFPDEYKAYGEISGAAQEILARSGLPGAESAGMGPVGEEVARPGAVQGQSFIQREFVNPEIAKERISTVKDQTDYARKLVENNQVDDLKTGLQYARALTDYQSGKRTNRPELPINMNRPVEIDPQTQQNIAQNQEAVRAALPEPEGLMGMRLVKRRQLGDDAIKRLGGMKNYNDALIRNILPRFVEIQKKLGGSNYLTGTIETIVNKAGLSSAEASSLMSVIGQAGFDKIKTDSGAAFTETELKMRRALLPQLTDTLDQAMGKIAALSALNLSDAANTMGTLQSGDYDIRGVKKMFNLDALDAKERVKALLEALPDNVTTNPKLLQSFITGLDPETKAEFINKLRSMKAK